MKYVCMLLAYIGYLPADSDALAYNPYLVGPVPIWVVTLRDNRTIKRIHWHVSDTKQTNIRYI